MNTKSSIYDVHYVHLYAGHLSETVATKPLVRDKHDFRLDPHDTLNETTCANVFEYSLDFHEWFTTGVKFA